MIAQGSRISDERFLRRNDPHIYANGGGWPYLERRGYGWYDLPRNWVFVKCYMP